MKSNPMLAIIIISVLLLSACGTKATPTVDPALMQASAVAAANTMLAMTQEAMPTDTPIPPTEAPTETPQPTPTIPLIATVPILVPPTTAPPSSNIGGECGGPIKASKGEPLASISINNRTNVLLQVSIGSNTKNSWGDCGWWSAGPNGIPPNSSVSTSLPAANSCYSVTAFTLAGKPNFMNFASFCVGMNPAHYTIRVTTETITIQ